MIIEKYLDPSAYGVVQGGVAETTELLNQKWDKIFYTGSGTVGTIVAKKAAETLTPVTLELGGRNPAIITRNADPRIAARRLLWGKIFNAGQVCLSENYVLVDKEILPAFLAELKVAMKEFYPNGAKNSPDYGRIVNQRHFNRIKSMLDNSNGKILFGGSMDEEDNFIEPTVIQVDDVNDSLMKDEIFGPLLPIYPIEDLDEAIRIANEVSHTPLALYAFGKKDETDRVLRETLSGGASINDAYFHATIPTMPFGGVGESGQGSYRGQASFDSFTHRRSVTTTPSWMESLLTVRYPPYAAGKLAKFQKMSKLKPNFDRDGKVRSNVLQRVLSLGGGDWKGSLGRYVILMLVAVGIRRYLEG
jgi:beta-apo-4'-carotenal oxygenase